MRGGRGPAGAKPLGGALRARPRLQPSVPWRLGPSREGESGLRRLLRVAWGCVCMGLPPSRAKQPEAREGHRQCEAGPLLRDPGPAQSLFARSGQSGGLWAPCCCHRHPRHGDGVGGQVEG